MAEFLEEVFPVGVRMGATYIDWYDVQITTTSSGAEYRKLTHQFPVRSFHVDFTMLRESLASSVQALYHRAYGMYAGFRVKFLDDFSTNKRVLPPTKDDWILKKISSGVYQLITGYGSGATPLGIGLPYRNIYKPVSGSVLVAKDGVLLSSGVSVNHTTGIVTITPAPTTEVITGGCYFHIPCRFNSKLEATYISSDVRQSTGIDLIELLKP